jgi:hypothetical protein
MDVVAQLRAQESLYLASLEEPEANELRIVVAGMRAQRQAPSPPDAPVPGAVRVEPDETTATFEILFTSYVGYLVRNETFALNATADTWTGGRLFRTYTQSEYLRFLSATTRATDEYPGPLRHTAIVCVDHVIDVVSSTVPEVRVLTRGVGV